MSDTLRTFELQQDIIRERYGKPLVAALQTCLELERALARMTVERDAVKKREIACFKCERNFTLAYIYRCFDCDVFLCKDCMRSHFGNQHKPHPLPKQTYTEES